MDDSPPDNSAQTMEPAPVEMNAERQSVIVKAPIGKAYEQWSRVEDLPKFITPLRSVEKLDETHFCFPWLRDGTEQPDVVHVVLRIPERRTAWRAVSDGFMSGVVSFEPCSSEDTEVTVKIRSIFDPPSLSQRLEEYLELLRYFCLFTSTHRFVHISELVEFPCETNRRRRQRGRHDLGQVRRRKRFAQSRQRMSCQPSPSSIPVE